MKLHHAHNLPDWELIPPESRNPWQRVAAATRGIVTVPNFLSIVGFAMVCIGLGYVVQGELLTGVIITAGGRICDLLDGIVAERTGTKSPIGGATDASFDKLGALAALLVLGTEQIVPWWAVALIGAQNTANSIIGAIGLHRRLKVRPVQAGKLSTALEWAAFFWFILTADNLTLWHWPAYVLLGAALILGIYATIAYARALSTPAASAASPSRARRT